MLDDLTDPADLRGLWPQGLSGRVLVTTRRRDAALAAHGHLVEVDLFTAAEARAYLTGRLNRDREPPQRLAEAADLAEDLGRLPLALAQAASYMLDRDLTCAAYRRRLAARRLELVLPEDAAADDYALTVAATWSLSVDLADQLPPPRLARPLLTLAAQLSPDGIPTTVFTTPAARAYLTGEEDTSRSLEVSAEVTTDDVDDAMHNLHRLSLITLAGEENENSAVRVHALVQRATREQADRSAGELAARTAAEALLQAWPEQDYQPQHALMAQSLRDNTDALGDIAPGPLWDPDGHPVLFRAARSRRDCGLLIQTVAYLTDLVEVAEQRLGPDHPDTLTTRNNLAMAYQDAGWLTEALPLFERTLTDRERLLGPDHPATLGSRNNLAAAYRDAGRLTEALPLLERTLTDCERMLGPAHPNTLACRANLAGAYRDGGRLAEALPLLERTVAETEQVLGSEHPKLAVGLCRLGQVYAELGHLPAAVAAFTRAVEVDTAAYGPNHSEVATDLEGLAAVQVRQGDIGGAAASRREAQRIRGLQ